MEVIYHISEKDLDALVQRVITHMQDSQRSVEVRWINPAEAMKRLNIKSKVTLYQLRVNGEIRYTQPRKRLILYCSQSIEEYLLRNAKDRF